MTAPRTAAVLGLGLIGGSIARGLAAKGVKVSGFDKDSDSVQAARRDGVIATVLDSSLQGLNEADWVILAVPVPAALDLLGIVSQRAPNAALITDTCSTKRSIHAEAARLGVSEKFVGSHPMAGSHKSGWSESRPDLFAGATTYICAESASASNANSTSAVAAAENLWTMLGARTERISALRHDQRVAATSHLPHMLSTTLAITLEGFGLEMAELGPGGKDMVRIAAADDALWQTILLDNADVVIEATDIFLAKLAHLRRALAERETDSVRENLARGRSWASELR